jgi:hypothetical protein
MKLNKCLDITPGTNAESQQKSIVKVLSLTEGKVRRILSSIALLLLLYSIPSILLYSVLFGTELSENLHFGCMQIKRVLTQFVRSFYTGQAIDTINVALCFDGTLYGSRPFVFGGIKFLDPFCFASGKAESVKNSFLTSVFAGKDTNANCLLYFANMFRTGEMLVKYVLYIAPTSYISNVLIIYRTSSMPKINRFDA